VQYRVAAEPLEVMAVLEGAVVAEKMYLVELFQVEQALQRPRLARRRFWRRDALQYLLAL
jgi:hypothetical protein